MIAGDIFPLLLMTLLALLTAPILTTIYFYNKIGQKLKGLNQILFCVFVPILTFAIMLVLQRQFPFSMSIWFLLYLAVMTILVIIQYNRPEKKE